VNHYQLRSFLKEIPVSLATIRQAVTALPIRCDCSYMKHAQVGADGGAPLREIQSAAGVIEKSVPIRQAYRARIGDDEGR
jgi:hypothetical protein